MLKENHYVEVKVSPSHVSKYNSMGYKCEKWDVIKIPQELLSEHSRQNVVIICDNCGKEFERVMQNYSKSKNPKNPDYCKACYFKIRKREIKPFGASKENYYDDYKEKFEELGYTILVNQIKNKKEKFPYRCSKHPDKYLETCLNYFDNGKGCMFCGKEATAEKRKLSIEDVEKRFEAKGLKLLCKEYKNNNTKMPYICDKHPNTIQYTSVGLITSKKHPCKYCLSESKTGANSPTWKGGISGLSSALRIDLKNWTLDSLKNNGFCCAVSGVVGCNMNVHHYHESLRNIISQSLSELKLETSSIRSDYNKKEYTTLRDLVIAKHYESGFGMSIAEPIHRLFHKLYGRHNNTPQQFDEFTLRYKLGEFNDTKVLPKKLWANSI